MDNVFSHFAINTEREDSKTIVDTIRDGVEFRGVNLWILIFAILIASLGLNVNSTAVIIGAMLISPLMGPIMGLGLGLGINDLSMVRGSLVNLLYAALVGLLSSTVYFSITPLNDAHSELLARTYPTVYDVLIAFFGGLAGMIATASRKKGNVLPGVAIATALMPPLCTAGYGLATGHLSYFFGAFYLFLINTVFIATATLVSARVLGLPQVHLVDSKAETRAHRMVISIVVVTLLPSVYLAYDLVLQDRFTKQALKFIEIEGVIPNDYLLNRKIDAKSKSIVLTYGGSEISEEFANKIRSKLGSYNLNEAKLEIKQGFAYLSEGPSDANAASIQELTRTLQSRDSLIRKLRQDSTQLISEKLQNVQILREVQAVDPYVTQIFINKLAQLVDSLGAEARSTLVVLKHRKVPSTSIQHTIHRLLSVRLQDSTLNVVYLHEK